MIKTITIPLILLIFQCVIQAQQFEFTTIAGSANGVDRAEDIEYTSSGHFYITGLLGSSSNYPAFFGEGSNKDSIAHSVSFFLAKYNKNEELKWVSTSAESYNVVLPRALSIGQDEKVYVSGQFVDSARFAENQPNDTTIYENNGGIFIAQYDSSGKFNWVMQTGGEQPCYPNDIAVDDSGNIYIGGLYSDTAYFGKNEPNDTMLVSNDGREAFIAKFSSDKKLKWAREIHSSGDWDQVLSVNIDQNLNVYISGNYDNSAILKKNSNDSIVLTALSSGNTYFAKYDENGNLLWAKNIYETNGYNFHSTSVIQGDKIYSNDALSADAVFGKDTQNETLMKTSSSYQTSFSIFDLDGNFLNVTSIIGARPSDMTIDSIGNIYAVGYIPTNEAIFGMNQRNTDTMISNEGDEISYVTKMSPVGEHIWAMKYSCLNNIERPAGVSSDSKGNIYLTGNSNSDTIYFYHYDSLYLKEVGYNNKDIYMAKVKRTFNHAPVVSWQGDTIFQEDFQGTDTLFFLAEEVEGEEGETITYTIDPDTSGIIDISLNETKGHLYLSSKDNQFGTRTFTVIADDGQKENYSTVIPINITVNPVNDKPIIESANRDFQISQGEALTLSLDDFTVHDVDNTYPDDFNLYTSTGDDFTLDGNTITPESDFTGTLNAQVYVYDGADSSDVFDIAIEVTETTSTNSSMADQIFVFPNPVKNVLNLKISLKTGT